MSWIAGDIGYRSDEPNGKQVHSLSELCQLHIPATPPIPVTITTNGCDFVFHIGETTAADKYALTTDIVCPEGKAIVWDFSIGPVACEWVFKPQSGLKGATITDNTNGTLAIGGTLESFHLEKRGKCGNATEIAGKWHLGLVAQGTSALGGATSVALSE